jgi:hypothetical protein
MAKYADKAKIMTKLNHSSKATVVHTRQLDNSVCGRINRCADSRTQISTAMQCHSP